MLPRFKVIVACDSKNGFSKNNQIPWDLPKDRKFLKEKTLGKGNDENVVVMGKETYLALPTRPLTGRKNVVISSTLKVEDHPDVSIFPDLLTALIYLGTCSYHEIYICGGERLYHESLYTFGYLCDKVYLTRVHDNYDCDRFFPFEFLKTQPSKTKVTTSHFTIFSYTLSIRHSEYQFLDLVKSVVSNGDVKDDRTGVGTMSKFGAHFEFDISTTVPAITTKKLLLDAVIKELLWMISGSTNSKKLEEQGVNIWKSNSSRSFLDLNNLNYYSEGDIGPLYGFQWRHWGQQYFGCQADYKNTGIDQLKWVINEIRTNPSSRRLIVNSWNVSQLNEMVLPPCHLLYQFNVSGQYLDCQVYQRSADLFLGVPFNMLFYSVLTYMIAHVTGLKPRKLMFSFGDAHVYNNHMEAVSKMLSKTPKPWARLMFENMNDIREIDDFRFENIKILGYKAWEYISAPMAV